MTSNRPYLMRAIYDWITDNDLTPYVLVDAMQDGVRVPPHVIKNGQVVLNLAMRAVANLELGNEWISFQARFSGASHSILIPISAVLALYAQENGQGMMFPVEEEPESASASTPASAPRAVEDSPRDDVEPSPPGDKPAGKGRGASHLRIVK
ncbi:ClpXP protease specificity-enhancing factor [Frateuria aurantia]